MQPAAPATESTITPEIVANTSLRLDTIRLRNFRAFTDFKLQLHPNLTVLVATNGCGKTAVLDGVAASLGTFAGVFDDTTGKQFRREDVRKTRTDDGLGAMEFQYPLETECAGSIGGRTVKWSRALAGDTAKTTTAKASVLRQYAENLQQMVRVVSEQGGRPGVLPFLSYYGTGRLWSEKRLTTRKESKQGTSRFAGYIDCLDSASSYKMFADWFERMSRAEYDARDIPDELELVRTQLAVVREAVDTALAPSRWRSITFKNSTDGIVVEHPERGTLPVEWLSDGIRSIVGLVADIAYRCVRLNAHLGVDAARSTPGILLIDEIDMHLHPTWQQVIVGALRTTFPSLQMIVTTHSPQVLTTVRRECVRILRGDEAFLPSQSTYGAPSGRVLSDEMRTEQRPPGNPVTENMERLFRMISEDDLEGAEALHGRMSAEMGPDESLVEADMMIRNARWAIGSDL